MTDHHEDDLAASKTEGFKVGEKKTIEEYTQLGMFTVCMVPGIHPAIHPARLLTGYIR